MKKKLGQLCGSVSGLICGMALWLGWTPSMQAQMPAPEPLVITGVTANTIGLAWNDIYNSEDGFRLTRADGLGNQATFQFGANVTTFLDTNLITGRTYYYQVVSFNSGGESYPAFNSATPTPIPGPEPLLITGVTANTVSLAWNDIYENEDGFFLTRWDNLGNPVTFQFGPNVTTYTDTNLLTGNTYYYQVIAFNSGGESAAAFNSATPTPVPAPEPLVITGVTPGSIGLSWSDIYTNEDGFRIERSTNSVDFSPVAIVPPNTTNYNDSGLNPLSTYFYRVAAFNSGGDSAYAINNATTLPNPPPVAPSALSATPASATRINLTWVDNAQTETGFNVYISTNGISFSLRATLAANVTAYASTGLTPATAFYFRVTAFNATGESVPSNVASATTLDVLPAAPSGLAATAVSSNRVDLIWTDNASNESGFIISRSTDGFSFALVATVGANVTTYSDTGLAALTTYYYLVRATNSGGYSAHSGPASATTGPAAPPAAPSNLTLAVVSSTQINLVWTDNSSTETQFLIERSQNGNTFTQVAAVSANVTNYSALGLEPNTRYYFRVRATNSAGNSAYSNTPNAKTLKH